MSVDPKFAGDRQFILGGFFHTRDRISRRTLDVAGVGQVMHVVAFGDVYDTVVRDLRNAFA